MPTYKDLFNALNAEYAKRSPGSALLLAYKAYNGAPIEFGLRVEVPDIMLEFTDHVKLGVDPKGDLFYDDLSEFKNLDDGGTKCYYQVHKIPITGDAEAKNAVKIKFYSDKGDETTVFAEFLARDIEGALNGWSAIDTERTGDWVYLNVGSASASLYKRKNDRYAVLRIDAIQKQIKIDLNDKEIISVWGDLTYRNIKNLLSGTDVYLDYTPDRVIFYPTKWQSNDYTAYFIQNNASVRPLNITTSGNTESIWEDHSD